LVEDEAERPPDAVGCNDKVNGALFLRFVLEDVSDTNIMVDPACFE